MNGKSINPFIQFILLMKILLICMTSCSRSLRSGKINGTEIKPLPPVNTGSTSTVTFPGANRLHQSFSQLMPVNDTGDHIQFFFSVDQLPAEEGAEADPYIIFKVNYYPEGETLENGNQQFYTFEMTGYFTKDNNTFSVQFDETTDACADHFPEGSLPLEQNFTLAAGPEKNQFYLDDDKSILMLDEDFYKIPENLGQLDKTGDVPTDEICKSLAAIGIIPE